MPIKAVIDTNIWVSALLNPGTARQIVQHLDAEHFQLYSSVELMAELINVLSRPKFLSVVGQEDVDELLGIIQDRTITIDVEQILAISRDPKDDVFLACSMVSNADYLVTGDNDLLIIQRHGTTKIVKPIMFLEILTSA